MRNAAHCGVWKVWLYAAASVALGAWISPLFFNAGKALAEVSSQKLTNEPLEKLAELCRAAEFSAFFNVGLLLAALVLFFPWMDWLHAPTSGQGEIPEPRPETPQESAKPLTPGQSLWKILCGPLQACAGFLVVSGILLSLGIALVSAGYFTLRMPPGGLLPTALRVLGGAILLATVMEVFFRGITLAVFLRSMRPLAAIAMSAVFFAIVLSAIPPADLNVADPEAAGIGFELLQKSLLRFADEKNLVGTFIPWLALGGVLAYARWSTASLWLPVGLHGGWLFGREMLARIHQSSASPEIGWFLQKGLIPLIAILLAGAMVRFFTAISHDEASPNS